MARVELVGRVDQMRDLVNDLHDGRGALVWGSAGVGKTALAAAVAERVADEGAHVDWVVATGSTQAMPFGALAPLFADEINLRLPHAVVLAAVLRRLRERGGRRPPVLIVDDAHLLDDASAAAVLALATGGTARLLVTVRSGERAPDAVGALWKDGYLATTMLAPFDRLETRDFLRHVLGGDVAAAAAELLWRHTRGNALFLSELAEEARARGQLVDSGGVWVWQGRPVVSQRLSALLARRFVGLSDAAWDVLGALVLGEPLAAETLVDIASVDAIGELEDRELVEVRDRGGRPEYHFSHPLLASATTDQLNTPRRRRVADGLIAAHGEHVDPVRAALWQLEASGPAAVGQLLTGARAVLLTQPELSRRLAAHALPLSDEPTAALVLADANAELGDVPAAHEALGAAADRVRSPEDRVAVALVQAGVMTFMERRPDVALDLLEEARRELTTSDDDVRSFAAVVLLFSSASGGRLGRRRGGAGRSGQLVRSRPGG